MCVIVMSSGTAVVAEVHWSQGWVLLPTHHQVRPVPPRGRCVRSKLTQVQPSQLGTHWTLWLHPRRKFIIWLPLSHRRLYFLIKLTIRQHPSYCCCLEIILSELLCAGLCYTMFTVSSALIWAVLTGPTDWVCHIGTLMPCVEVVA